MRALVLVAALLGCSPMSWHHHVPNLSRVDESIWRSGQIDDARGWAFIEKLAHGRRIHDVKLNYDFEGSDSAPADVIVEYLPIEPAGDQGARADVRGALDKPDEITVQRALAVLETCRRDPKHEWCLVHCTHGQDRTGYIVGRLRLLEGWDKRRAFEEMRAHNFHVELVGLMLAWFQ